MKTKSIKRNTINLIRPVMVMFLILTICVINAHFFPASANEKPSDQKKRSRKEYKKIRKVEKQLRRYTIRYEKKTKNVLKRLSRHEKNLLKKDSACAIANHNYDSVLVAFHRKIALAKQRYPQYLPDTIKYNKAERVKRHKIRIARSVKQYNTRVQVCNEAQRQITVHKVSLLKKIPAGNLPAIKAFRQIDKSAFYNKVNTRYARNLFAKNLRADIVKQQLANARKSLPALNTSFKEQGLDALRGKMQVNKDVLASMPQNKPGASEETKMALKENMEKSMAKFDKMKTSAIDLEDLKDTITFKPNPYRGLPLKERLDRSVNWQFMQPFRYTPAVVDLALTFGYKLNSRTTPFVGMSYKLGLGNGIQDIRFSHQGFSIRSGMELMPFKYAGCWISYEHSWLVNNNSNAETKNTYNNYDAAIIGIFLKGGGSKKGMKVMAGYDLMYHFDQRLATPLIIRIGID